MFSHRAVSQKTWQRPTLPYRYQYSTIGAGELNCRVRNGNGCFLLAIVTRIKSDPLRNNALHRNRISISSVCPGKPFLRTISPVRKEKKIKNEVARLISTRRLNVLPRVYREPIDLVIYKESLVLAKGDIILG